MNQTERDQALTVKCAYCNAQIGQPCTNKATGQPLQFAAAHTPRLIEAIPF